MRITVGRLRRIIKESIPPPWMIDRIRRYREQERNRRSPERRIPLRSPPPIWREEPGEEDEEERGVDVIDMTEDSERTIRLMVRAALKRSV